MHTPTHLPRTRRAVRRVALIAAAAAVVLPVLGSGQAAQAQTAATPYQPGNPLGKVAWGIDNHDQIYRWYTAAGGTNKALLAKIARRPRVFWFHEGFSPAEVDDQVRRYIKLSQEGDENKLVQLATFRLWPRTQLGMHVPLTLADQAAYKRWVDQVARGIGTARAVVIVEPDLPLAYKAPNPEVRLRLAKYAVRKFDALPRTTVYLDAGSGDWLKPAATVRMLRAAGVAYARGFSLGATHYTALGTEIAYGTQVVAGLRAAGIPRRKFVIETADNARPFTYEQYYAKHPGGLFDNAEVCRSLIERRCSTLGVPPTTHVWRSGTGLAPHLKDKARAHVDAYLWYSRPWFVHYGLGYSRERALQLARTTPY